LTVKNAVQVTDSAAINVEKEEKDDLMLSSVDEKDI
jgi:hypothetical protein